MRIALDLSSVGTNGTTVHSLGFLPALARLLSDDELIVLAPKKLERLLAPFMVNSVAFLSSQLMENAALRILWQQFVLPRLLRTMKVDVLFAAYDIGPWRVPCPLVLGVKNPTPVLLASGLTRISWMRGMKGLLHQFLVRGSCRAASLLIFPSKFSARTVGDLLDTPSEKRVVINHGLDLPFWSDSGASASRFPSHLMRPGKYVLFASRFYPQKRAELLLEAFGEWRLRFGRSDYKLVFCGEDSRSRASKTLQRRIKALGLTSEVVLLGNVDRDVLIELFRHAAQFVLPTLVETFGLPYVEALASKLPLVCADIEIAREICGDAAWYFEPNDRSALALAMQSVIQDDDERDRKVKLGAQRAADFSWHKEAEATLRCIRAAVKTSSSEMYHSAHDGQSSPGRAKTDCALAN